MAEKEEKSLLARLASFKLFGFGSEDTHTTLSGDVALSQLGISVLQSMTLEERIKRIEDFLKEIKEREDLTPIERVELMDKVIQTAVVPFGRGADRPAFIEMIGAWADLVAMFRDFYRTVEESDLDPLKKQVYMRVLDAIAKNEMYTAFAVVVAASFSDEDVARNMVAVIQNVVMAGSSPPVPVQDATSFILQRLGGASDRE